MKRSRPLFDHFGLLAPVYERLISPPDPGKLLGLSDPAPGDHLLDVGGGTGRASRLFQGRVSRICVVDVSRGMLDEARAHGLGACLGAAEHLPFRDGAFKRILVVDSFHHFRDQRWAAHEMVRVLAPGGRLVIEEPDVRTFGVKLIALAEKLALMRSHFYPPAAIARFFDAPGLRARIHEDGSPNVWVIVEKPLD